MITGKNHKLLTSQICLTDCTKKWLASMYIVVLSMPCHEWPMGFECTTLVVKALIAKVVVNPTTIRS